MPIVNSTFPKGFYLINVLEVKKKKKKCNTVCELDLLFLFFSSDQACSLVAGEKELIPPEPEEAPASETDIITLEVSFAEQAVNQKESSKDGTQKNKGYDTLLPVRSTDTAITKQKSLFLISFLF